MEIEDIKQYIEDYKFKYNFIWPLFPTNRNKASIESYESKLEILNKYREEQGRKLKNIISWKLYKEDYEQQTDIFYVFTINNQKYRFSAVEMVDYGFIQLSRDISLKIKNNIVDEQIIQIEKDILEFSFSQQHKSEIKSKRRL